MTKNEIIEVLEQYENLLEKNDFISLKSEIYRGNWAEILDFILSDLGIDVLKYMDTIPPHFFEDCQELKIAKIPSKVKSIGEAAFLNCSNLAKVAIEDGPTEIGVSAFQDCVNLQEVRLPNTFKTLQRETFKNCSNIKSLFIPDSVKVIGSSVFEGCTQEGKWITINRRPKTPQDKLTCKEIDVPFFKAHMKFENNYHGSGIEPQQPEQEAPVNEE